MNANFAAFEDIFSWQDGDSRILHMADLGNIDAPFGERRQEEQRNWTPMIIGGVLVAVIVAAVVIIGRSSSDQSNTKSDPYTQKLQLSNLHMATAENFAGGSVTYIEGNISNTGDKKVTGATVELLFKNSLGETSQKENSVVMVRLPNVPYVDYGAIQQAPLAPGQSRDFRLTLEHVTADWDGQVPQVRVVSVAY